MQKEKLSWNVFVAGLILLKIHQTGTTVKWWWFVVFPLLQPLYAVIEYKVQGWIASLKMKLIYHVRVRQAKKEMKKKYGA